MKGDAESRATLHAAAAYGAAAQVIKMLADAGAGVNARDNLGRTPLHLAVGGLTVE